jgi:hypothetical protein
MIRIAELVIVAGPTCVGKTTLLARLRNGELPTLASSLGLDAGSDSVFLDAVQVEGPMRRRKPERLERLVLHYDTCRPARLGLADFVRDPVLDLLGEARRVAIVTLWATADELYRRTVERRERSLRGWKRLAASRTQVAEWARLELLYQERRQVLEHYESWLRFCTRYDAASHGYISGMERNPLLADRFPFFAFASTSGDPACRG